MKSISELRKNIDFNIERVVSRLKYLKSRNVDFDVFLPSLNMNLQRDFVWNIDQKREIVYSVILGRHVPHLAIMNILSDDKKEDIYQIIDGKQRLSSLFDFLDDKFTIILEGNEYLFSELPDDYKLEISNFNLHHYIVNENYDNKITDKQKIDWFKFLNFAGTPQDKEHLDKFL